MILVTAQQCTSQGVFILQDLMRSLLDRVVARARESATVQQRADGPLLAKDNNQWCSVQLEGYPRRRRSYWFCVNKCHSRGWLRQALAYAATRPKLTVDGRLVRVWMGRRDDDGKSLMLAHGAHALRWDWLLHGIRVVIEGRP